MFFNYVESIFFFNRKDKKKFKSKNKVTLPQQEGW